MNNQLKKQLFLEYCLTLAIYAVMFLIFALSFGFYLTQHIWYETDPFYEMLHWINYNRVVFYLLVCLTGWLIISIFYMLRFMNYLGEVVVASKQLMKSKESIRLSADLKLIEDELNVVRNEALRNEEKVEEEKKKKDELLVYLAHDLKTPLTSVIGYLTLLNEGKDISIHKQKDYLHISLNKAKRLEELINEFFEITKFTLTNVIYKKEDVDFSFMLHQICNEFYPLLQDKNLSLKLEIEKNIHLILDIQKIERVIDNLIKNAINYCFENSVIDVELFSTDELVILRISNEGKTIEKQQLDKLFEPFYRIDDSRLSMTGGSGLGLSISKQIVEKHDGKLQVKSFDNRVIFTLVFPNNKI